MWLDNTLVLYLEDMNQRTGRTYIQAVANQLEARTPTTAHGC